MNERVARTFVSPLYLAIDQNFSTLDSDFPPSELLLLPGAIKQSIHWLDMLLNGGFRLPYTEEPLIILLSGPPGAGKSMLAQQICLSRARHSLDELAKLPDSDLGPAYTSVILTTEAPTKALIDNLYNLGWHNCQHNNYVLFGSPKDSGNCAVTIVDATTLTHSRSDDHATQLSEYLNTNLTALSGQSILVIDSLNYICTHSNKSADSTRHEAFDTLYKWLKDGSNPNPRPKICILVLDSPALGESPTALHNTCEYLADIVIKLDFYHESELDYLRRSIEIVKARYQRHIAGRHVLKIYSRTAEVTPSPMPIKSVWRVEAQKQSDTHRAVFQNPDVTGPRPVLREGGVFIYPSIHQILALQRTDGAILKKIPPLNVESTEHSGLSATTLFSLLSGTEKRNYTTIAYGPFRKKDEFGWPVPFIAELLGGKRLRANSCTAITGSRATHKALIAGHFVLDAVELGHSTLIVSFYEDESIVMSRLQMLISDYRHSSLKQFKLCSHVNVLHQKPSGITPEEFLHRILYWICAKGIARVVISTIGGWDASFPELAKSKLFVPTLVDSLRTHNVTSLFLGLADASSSLAQSGLESNADTILRLGTEDVRLARGKLFWRPSEGPEMDGFTLNVPLVHLDEGSPLISKIMLRHERTNMSGAVGKGRGVLNVVRCGPDSFALDLIPLAPEPLATSIGKTKSRKMVQGPVESAATTS